MELWVGLAGDVKVEDSGKSVVGKNGIMVLEKTFLSEPFPF